MSPQAHFIRLYSEQAQIPKKSTTDSILNANKWMRREENIYKGLLDLKPDMETMRLDDNRPKNKHLKHGANKVLVGHREASKKEGIQVPC